MEKSPSLPITEVTEWHFVLHHRATFELCRHPEYFKIFFLYLKHLPNVKSSCSNVVDEISILNFFCNSNFYRLLFLNVMFLEEFVLEGNKWRRQHSAGVNILVCVWHVSKISNPHCPCPL